MRTARRAATVVMASLALVLTTALPWAVEAPASAAAGDLHDPTTYPARGFDDVKGIQPDFWPDPTELAPGLGTVSVNLLWAHWEPAPVSPPCTADQIDFDGRCFVMPPGVEAQVRAYTDLGVAVTGILYGTPAWARGDRPCVPTNPGFEIFCVPDDPAEFARFTGMIARHFDGAGDHGRVVDFVIQNEVNTNEWFNTGCGAGTPCDLDAWIGDYAAIWNGAHDSIRLAQPEAHVLFSFTHHFDTTFDRLDLVHPIVSIKTFLVRLVPLVGDRDWSVALHPYPNNLDARLDARDLPWATLGNVGVLPGWLRATYPDDPHAWEVQLTEVGIHNPDTQDDAQADAVCASLRNILGTPGITSYIYHRLVDQAGEFGLSLGLRRSDGSPKPAYAVWRHATDPDAPTCGFELDGHTRVRHGIDPSTGAHWYSSRDLPTGYIPQTETWTLAYAERPDTAMLHECGAGPATWLWPSADCAGAVPMGPVGWIARSPASGMTALWTCTADGVHTVTTRSACPAGTDASLLGYVEGSADDPAAIRSDPVPVHPAFTG